VEWAVLYGVDASGIGPKTLPQFKSVWESYGSDLLENFIRHLPGSRPWPLYFLNIIPPLKEVEHPVMAKRTIRIGNQTWWESAATYDKYGQGELEHLLACGIVDKSEAKRASERLRKSGRSTAPYVWLSQPGM